MRKLHGEESNYLVLEEVLKALKKGEDQGISLKPLIEQLDEFLAPKRKIQKETSALTILARGGDDEAARKLMRKLAEMNDGP